ncbi:MAG: zf-HC2 domain-containing protein [Nitrospirae bacterium]|nr:zf-HC2 domain-containing protein [Nitrospirota bacterium]
MDCGDARKIINEYIDGNSPSGQQALIEEHLRSCRDCAAYAADIKKTIETLHTLDEIEPPAWLTAKVMNKIRAEARPKKGWREWLFFPLHIKLPLEAFAAILITVAAVFIYKSMGPELRQMEIQPQAPVVKSMPAEPEKELQKPEIQKKSIQQPQRLEEEAKHKDNAAKTETRELSTLKEEKPVEQQAPAPITSAIPAPASSFAPAPAPPSAMRRAETGKAAGMASRDEAMQRVAPAAPRSELSAEKKAAVLTTITLAVRELDTAKKEIEAYIAKSHGELKVSEESESRIILTIKLDPSKNPNFLAHLGSLGRIKEDLRVLSLQGGLFKLIIEEASSGRGFPR